MLNWNFHSFKLLEIIQVLDSISWVRCASGNVYVFILGYAGRPLYGPSRLLLGLLPVFFTFFLCIHAK